MAYISGAGLTKVKSHWDLSLEDLAVEAGIKALEDSGHERVDAIVVANSFSGTANGQEDLSSIIVDHLGIRDVPSFKVSLEGASGAAAVITATTLVNSGAAKRVLVIGVEKMSDVTALEDLTLVSSTSLDRRFEREIGATTHSQHALIMRTYMRRYGIEEEDFGHFPVLMHENACAVPHAQFRYRLKLENYMKSPYLAEPLKLFDVPAEGDGAAAVVISEKGEVKISGFSISSDKVMLSLREDLLKLDTVRASARRALSMAGLDLNSISFVKIHDNSSALAYLQLESIGLAEEGKAPQLTAEGKFSRDGEMPVNPEGGLKARGYPVGASAVYQAAEAYLQLAGRAGESQINGAKSCLLVSLSGIGSSAASLVLTR